MSNLINKVVTGLATTAMAVSMLVIPATSNVHAASAGEVYKTSDGTVWFITKDMKRRPFTSAGAFLSYGFLSFSQVKDADSSVTSLPTGDFIAPQDGRIFCATETKGSDVKGECSLITGGQKAAFTSASVFGGQGYSFGRAFYGDSSFLSKTSNIDNASAQHRNGTLVNNGGTVQLVVTGGLWGVPSMDVFNSWGWSFADVVPANAADKVLSQIGVIPARMAGDLVPTGVTGGGSTGTGDCGLTGGAGDANITKNTSDVESEVKEGDNNIKVNSFKVEATDSDIAVKSVKVSLANDASGSASTRLDRYAGTVSIYEGNTKVGSASVSDFTKDGSVYSKSIALNCAVVKEGTGNKQNFYVAISANSNIDGADLGGDNSWYAGVSNIRFQDGQGAILTSDYGSGSMVSDFNTSEEGVTNFSFIDLASSSDVKFKVSESDSNPAAGTVEVSDSASTKNVPLVSVDLNAQKSDMTFDQMSFTVTSTGDNIANIVSEFQLKKGSTVLATVSGSDLTGMSDTLHFNLDNDFTVNADSTSTLTVYATLNKVNGNYTQGDTLTASYLSFNGSVTDQNGDTFNSVTGSATGNVQTLYSEGVSMSDFTSSSVATTATDGTTTKQTFTISYKVHAFGNTYYIPKTVLRENDFTTHPDDTGLTYVVQTSAGANVTIGSGDVLATASSLGSTCTTIGSFFKVADGSTCTLTTTIELASGDTGAFYRIQLANQGYDINSTLGGTLFARFLPVENYQTASVKVD